MNLYKTNLFSILLHFVYFMRLNSFLHNSGFRSRRRFDWCLRGSSSFVLCLLHGFLCRWSKNLKGTHQIFINTHYTTSIIKFTAIIGCRENRYQLTFCKEFITIFDNLRTINIDDYLDVESFFYWYFTWCPRQIKSKSWRVRKRVTTSVPNVNETPRSFSPHSDVSLSGSDHNKSQSNPKSFDRVKTYQCMLIEIYELNCQSLNITCIGNIGWSSDATYLFKWM